MLFIASPRGSASLLPQRPLSDGRFFSAARSSSYFGNIADLALRPTEDRGSGPGCRHSEANSRAVSLRYPPGLARLSGGAPPFISQAVRVPDDIPAGRYRRLLGAEARRVLAGEPQHRGAEAAAPRAARSGDLLHPGEPRRSSEKLLRFLVRQRQAEEGLRARRRRRQALRAAARGS